MPKLNRDGVNIYYEVHGSGPPLILTHGYSSTSGMWHGQIAALSRHYKLVLWDMRGHGQSDYPADSAAYSEALTVAENVALGMENPPAMRDLAARISGVSRDYGLPLDPSQRDRNKTSKIVIDATRQWPGEGGPELFPRTNRELLTTLAPDAFVFASPDGRAPDREREEAAPQHVPVHEVASVAPFSSARAAFLLASGVGRGTCAGYTAFISYPWPVSL